MKAIGKEETDLLVTAIEREDQQTRVIAMQQNAIAEQRNMLNARDSAIRDLLGRLELLEGDRATLSDTVRILVRESDLRAGRSVFIPLPPMPPPERLVELKNVELPKQAPGTNEVRQ